MQIKPFASKAVQRAVAKSVRRSEIDDLRAENKRLRGLLDNALYSLGCEYYGEQQQTAMIIKLALAKPE